jgi:transcriptional regulator with XRE-family HTH domain
MESTSKLPPISERDLFYYRQRSRNRLFESLSAFFAEEMELRGITKRDIAECLRRDPAQITRWLSAPSNMTNDTISDMLLCLGAEMDHSIAPFRNRVTANEMHPLIEKLVAPAPQANVARAQVLSKRYRKVENAASSPTPVATLSSAA